MLSLNTITDGTMDVEDAFAKLREQILAYDNPDSDAERTGGLNLINTTNLSFFHASQKSEVFRLKAYFLESLGGRSKANRAFCHSVQICPSFAKSWASWGGLCSSLGKLAERQHEIESSKSGKSESNEVGHHPIIVVDHAFISDPHLFANLHSFRRQVRLQRRRLHNTWPKQWVAISRRFNVTPMKDTGCICRSVSGCSLKMDHLLEFSVRLWRHVGRLYPRGYGSPGSRSC